VDVLLSTFTSCHIGCVKNSFPCKVIAKALHGRLSDVLDHP
jgi:hypothetical protein